MRPWIGNPADHCSFKGQRHNRHNPHGIKGTRGAEFLPGLTTDLFQVVWRKGYERHRDCYSLIEQYPAFPYFLLESGIERVAVCGLATNICVLDTSLHLLQGDMPEVVILEDCSRGIDIPELGIDQHNDKLRGQAAGVVYATLDGIAAVWFGPRTRAIPSSHATSPTC
jgi:nicotinamidase-related amidase